VINSFNDNCYWLRTIVLIGLGGMDDDALGGGDDSDDDEGLPDLETAEDAPSST
jgi:hypothetical protein